MKKSEVWFQFLLSTFIASIVVSNVITGKLIQFGNFTLPGATLLYPITFLITDIVGEIWGKERGFRIVLWGFYGNVILLLGSLFILRAPAPGFFENQSAYEIVLGATPRIVLASMVAYLFSQLHDVWSFAFWKKITRDKHKWIRNNFSTIVSQLIDTGLFVLIAFAGVVPTAALWQIAFSQYLFKFAIAIADTPIFYYATAAIERSISKEEESLGKQH
ncbi:MAG: hypothetical protein FD169_1752 [Bacillota bacterium]|nr:MAG: hypothetical protein FD169_1752 [Bacillota bacterium]MBS3949398.1 queuosine precursor transporter [Peptococcaceae bacterium]